MEKCNCEFEDDDGMGVFICDRPKGHGGLHESVSWQRAGEAPLRTRDRIEEKCDNERTRAETNG